MPKDPSKGGRDNYPTPQPIATWAVGRALQLCPTKEKVNVLEPGCGQFAPFAHAAHEKGCIVTAVEKDKITKVKDFPTDYHFLTVANQDYFKPGIYLNPQKFNIIATNPPYNVAEEFYNRSMELLHPYGILTLLLRIQFLSSKKRIPLFRKHPPYEVGIFCRRISFDGVGTDYTEYCQFFWLGKTLDAEYREKWGKLCTKFYWVDNSNMDNITTFGL